MRFAATRIITDDVEALTSFYERVTGLPANRRHPLFVELPTPSGTLAISSAQTVPAMGEGVAETRANRTAILDFLVDDVDAEYLRLRELDPPPAFENEPSDMPWGNRSLLFRDLDGNLVNFFTPLTEEARARHGQ